MKTACPGCGSEVVKRVYLELQGDDPLFAETYGCGSVRLWGLAPDDNVVRKCLRPQKDPALNSPAE